ncbi:MAG: MFS transporter [Anaerolineaceae bacterium]|nr:MFS transporter [Anaerolineaceae bacterium]
MSTAPTHTRRSLALIFIVLLMDVIGITILGPVAPYIVKRYSDAAIMVSMITVIYTGAQFFAAPLLGKLGDRYGRRPVLLISLIGQAAGYLVFGIGGSLAVLFLGRLIGGITGGNMSTASAYIADVSKPEDRAKNFTLIGVAWGLGLVLGPALGGIFGEISLEAPAFFAAALSMLNVLVGYFILPESLPVDQRDKTPLRASDFNPIVSIYEMARKPGLAWVLVVLALFNFSFNGINSTSALFFIHKFNAQTSQISLLMVLSGIALAFVQLLLVRRLVPRFGEKPVAIASMLGQSIGNLLIFFAPLFWMVYPINLLISGISGFTFPTLTTLCTNRVQHREVGLLMGVTTAIGSLMGVAGPLFGGAVFDNVMPGAPYWMGSILFVLAAFMLTRLSSGKPPEPIQETIQA